MKYRLYTDGGSRGNPGPSGIGAVLKDNKIKIVNKDNPNWIYCSK